MRLYRLSVRPSILVPLLLAFVACGVYLLVPQHAAAQVGTYAITAYDSRVTVATSTVHVQETVKVNFIDPHHGIYRDIPVQYQITGTSSETGVVTAGLSNMAVLRDGKKEPFEVAASDANRRMRIGKENVEISGVHTYVITYDVTGIISPYTKYDELYWNVTGDAWDTAVGTTTATVLVPQEVVQASCYQGLPGSQETCIQKVATTSGKVSFTSRNLAKGEQLTVAVAFPKGLVATTSYAAATFYDTRVFVWPRALVIALLAFLGICAVLARLWWMHGRERVNRAATLQNADDGVPVTFERDQVYAEYEPPQHLRPAELGLLMDQSADTLDISASIVDLAVRGYLTITEVPKTWIFGSTDYKLTRTALEDTGLMRYEKKLLAELFIDGNEVLLSALKNSFYKKLEEVKTILYEEAVEKKFFPENPSTKKAWYWGSAIVMGAVGIMGTANIPFMSYVPYVSEFFAGCAVALAAGAVVTPLVGQFMPRRTAYGHELYRRTKGFKLFVSNTERYRQPFFEKQNLFMEILPYAMVFGVTKKLADAMEKMGVKQEAPAWYHSTTPFNAAAFGSTINTFSNSLSSAIASAPSGSGSGGGGSAGGGFGGGGGGGW